MDVRNDIPIQTSGVVVLSDNAVLLVAHTAKAGHVAGVYGLPAGRIENGENAIETAQRELSEETGLHVEASDLIPIPHSYVADIPRSDGTIKRMSMTCFLARKTSGSIRPSSDGATVPEWVAIKDLTDKRLLPHIEDIVRDALQLVRSDDSINLAGK